MTEKISRPKVWRTLMASKSSYFLAVLLIANPFMLLFFQNCSPNPQNRNVASVEKKNHRIDVKEFSYRVDKNLIKK
jgi:hypothetical protein